MRAWAMGVLLLSTMAAAQDDRPRLVAQLGHADTFITEAVFSPDGRYVLTGGKDGWVIVWEVSTGREVRRLPVPGGGTVLSLVFTRDGRRLLAGLEGEPKAVLWDMAAGRILREVRPVNNSSGIVGLSPDGRFIAMNGTQALLDAASGEEVAFGGESFGEFKRGATYSPDGRWLATLASDGYVLLWEAATGKLVRRLPAWEYGSWCPFASFAADGTRVAARLDENTGVVWETATGREVRRVTHPEITALSLSPDGRRLATGDELDNSVVRVWDVETGKELWRGRAGSDIVYALDFSPDGRLLVSGAYSNPAVAVVWDAATGEEVHFLGTAAARVPSARFASRGRLAIQSVTFGKPTNDIHLWDGRAGRVVQHYEGDLEVSSDGRRVFSRDGDHLRVVDLATGKARIIAANGAPDGARRVRGADGRVVARLHPERRLLTPYSAVVSPDGRRLFCDRAPVHGFDLETGRAVGRLETRGRPLAFSPDGKFLYTSDEYSGGASMDKPVVTKWDAASLKKIATLAIPATHIAGDLAAVRSEDRESVVVRDLDTGEVVARLAHDRRVEFSFSRDGRQVVTCVPGGAIRVWDSRAGTIVREFGSHGPGLDFVAVSPAARLVFTCFRSDARLWDAGAGRELHRLRGVQGRVSRVAFARDGSRVAVSDWANFVRVWSTRTGRETCRLGRQPGTVYTLAFLPDGRLLALTDVGIGRVWDADGTLVRTYRFAGERESRFLARSVSPDERFVLTGSENASPVLWEAATGNEIRRFDGHAGAVHAVAFAPDGKTAVSGSADRTVIVWEVATGRRMRQFLASAGIVYSVAFSRDGSAVAAGGEYGEVLIWDVKTGRPLFREIPGRGMATGESAVKVGGNGHTGAVFSLDFSPDDSRLLTGGQDGTARLWSMTTGEELCRLINFNDGSWVVVDSEGRFDASDAGDVPGLYWVVGNESISLDQLKERYYEPGLLGKALGLDSKPRRSVEGFTAPKLFPGVRVEPPAGDDATLGIHLTNRGGGIGRVVVLVNGKEVAADARGEKPDPDAKQLALAVDLAGDPRLKPGEENTIEVMAYNAEGYLRSRGMRAKYKAPGEKGAAPQLWAVVVGVADYQGDAIDLRYASKDAADFAQGLAAGAKALFGVERVHVTLLPDARRAELVEALEAAQKARPTDILVLYLAGHGVNYGGQDGDFYFLTKEARSADLADPAVRGTTALSSRELTELVKRIPAEKQVLILDTCASGKFVEKLTAKRDVPTSQLRALDRLKDRTGLHILAGCAADRVSYEATQYAQGLLTYSLLLGMRGAALRRNEYVDVSTLFEFAADKVPELAGEIGGIQRPVIARPKGGSSFDIGLLSEEAKVQVPLRTVRPMVLRSNFQDDEQLVDVLDLAKQVNRRLSESTKLVFVDAGEFPEAYRVFGRYQVDGDAVTVDVRLVRGDKVVRFTVAGEKAAIAARIVAEVERRLP